MICIVVASQDKWTTVLDGKAIGTSKHVDYSIFHFKAHDVASLKKPITMFIWVGTDDKVIEVIMTSEIKERGQNYKTAKREPAESLSPAELALVNEAIGLARAAPQPKAPAPVMAHAAGQQPTEDKPTFNLSPEGAATGLTEVIAQSEALTNAHTPNGEPEPSPEGEPVFEAGEDPPADDPLEKTELSRSHNRKRRR